MTAVVNILKVGTIAKGVLFKAFWCLDLLELVDLVHLLVSGLLVKIGFPFPGQFCSFVKGLLRLMVLVEAWAR